MDLTEDQQREPDIAQEDLLETKELDDPDSYYYYFDERVLLQERKDLLLVCFTGAQERRDFIQELNNVSCWKIWNPALSKNWTEDNAYNLLVLQAASGGEIPKVQMTELLNHQGVKYVSYIYGKDEHHLSSVSEDGEYPSESWNNEVGYGLVKANYALSAASGAHLQNSLDNTSGLDFTITNSSSYDLDDVIVDVQGTIGGTLNNWCRREYGATFSKVLKADIRRDTPCIEDLL